MAKDQDIDKLIDKLNDKPIDKLILFDQDIDKIFFSIFRGVGGLFTRTEFLSFDTLSCDHLATTRGPVSFRIRFMTCRSFLDNKKNFPKGGAG